MKILKDSTYEALLKVQKDFEEFKAKTIQQAGKPVVVSDGPSSRRDESMSFIAYLQKKYDVLMPDYELEVIPIIRKLVMINPDMGQAMDDLVKLANTGHKIKFDADVDDAKVDEMREYLREQAKDWHVGTGSIHGIVNKMFRQIMVGGASCIEWVPNMNLDGVSEVIFLYPERIRFVKERNNRKYAPYQLIKNKPIDNGFKEDMVKLNINQFKYIALNGDTDKPYGIPSYLKALEPIKTQKMMVDNLSFIVESLGMLGFMTANIEKPDQKADETDTQYLQRLKNYLSEFKESLKSGYRDGFSVGYKEDVEFDFKSTTKNVQGVNELYNLNELIVASGLSYDAAFMGRPGSTETLITILFTKMLAQLYNIQLIVRDSLEFGYTLALRLAGYKFKNLHVEFNRSTITDELKYQQAMEIRVRNLIALYNQGIIGQEQFADEMGYEGPDEKEPRMPADTDAVVGGEVKRVNREKDKDKSDRTSRDKSKPQGTVRRQNSYQYRDLIN